MNGVENHLQRTPSNAVAVCRLLLDAGAAIDGPLDDGAPLRTALQFGYTETARTLERRGARVDAPDLAAGLGRDEVLADLWQDAPVDMDSTGSGWQPGKGGRFQAFLLACRNGQAEAGLRLLDLGVDTTIPHGRWKARALDFASYNGCLECVQALLDHGATANLEEALVSAAGQNHLDVARRLLRAGADSERALVQATQRGHDEMVALLN